MANIYEGWSRFEQDGSMRLPEFQKMIDNLAGNDFKNASIVGRVLNNDTAKGFTSFMVEGLNSRAMNEATVLGVDFVDMATMWTIANSQEFINEFGNWKTAYSSLKEGHKRTLVRGRQYSRGMVGKLYPNGEPRVAYLIKFLYEKTKTPEQKAEAVQYFKQAMKSVVGDAYNEALGTIDPNMTEDHRIYEWAEIINGLGGEYEVRILPQTTVEAQRRYVQRLKNYDFISDKRMPELPKSESFFYTIPKILSDEVVATSRGEWDGYVPTQLDHEKFHVLEEKLRKETGGTMGVKRSKDGTGDAYLFAVDKTTLNETEGMKISKDKFQYQRLDEPIVNYHFRAVDNILKNIVKIRQWEANKSVDENTLYKKIAELGIPKEQLSLIRESEGNTIEEKIVSFTTAYSYSVEIETAIGSGRYSYIPQFVERDGRYFEYDEEGEPVREIDTKEEFDIQILKAKNIPSQYYSNLTVPGGTNYTENRIITPNITPSIKGHPQFAQDNDIGWFRSDDKTIDTLKGSWIKSESELPNEFVFSGERYFKEDGEWQTKSRFIEDIETVIWRYNMSLGNERIQNKPNEKTRRILEIQSDLFQKGRNNIYLTGDTITGPIQVTSEQFLQKIKNEVQRLEDESDLFFVNTDKVTIEGREYERLPDGKWYRRVKDEYAGDINKNQFLQLLNKDGNWVSFFIKSIVQDSARKGYEKVLFPSGETAAKIEGHETLANELNRIDRQIEELNSQKNNLPKRGTTVPIAFDELGYSTEEREIDSVEKINNTIKELEQRKSELKSQGIEKLKPIEGFYEVRVKNTLDKIYGKQNVNRITDEYGNDWFEITITEEMRTEPIQLQVSESIPTEATLELATLEAIADKLSERTGVPYRITELADAAKELGVEEKNVPIAYFTGQEVVFVNSNKLQNDTPFHEFAHPFVDVICKRNTPLFGNLKKKLAGSPAGQEIIEEVKRKYPELVVNGELIENGWKEAITTALGRMAATDSLDVAPENRGLWGVIQTLIKAIQNFINRYMLGEGINPISLSANTSFRELADMLSISEQSIILNKKELDTRIQKQVAGAAPGFRTNEMAKRLVAIRAEISNQIYAVNRSERDRSTKKELLKKLNDMLATIEAGLDTPIDDMVNSAHEALTATTEGIMKDISDLMAELGTKEVGSPEAGQLAAMVLSNLNLINDYIKAFDWLLEIEKGTFKHNKLYEFAKDETTVKMNEAIKMYREAKDFYDSQFKAVLAKTLEPILKEVIVELQPQITEHVKALEAEIREYEKNGKEKKAERAKKRLEEYKENIASRAPQDAKELEALFSRASKDVAFTEYFLGSAINSRDFVMSLFVKAIAKVKERAMRRTANDVSTITKIYKEFVGLQGASRDNVEKLNSAIIETVTRYETVTDKDGKRTRVPRTYKMFVQEYDEDAYNKEYEKAREEYNRLKKEGKATKSYWYNWYKANREPRTPAEQAIIRAEKKKVLTAEEFENWEKGRAILELSRPKISIYPNAKWNAMYKTDAAGNWVTTNKAGEYHKQLLATYLEKQKSYPPGKRNGNVLPSVSKSTVDRLWEQGLISGAKNWTKEQFGKFAGDSYVYSNNGSMKDKILPTYYTDYMDAEDVSNNVFASVLLYAKEANNYDELYRTRAELAAMTDVMHERGAKSIGETDEFGNIKERRQNAGMRKALKGAGLTDIDNKETSNLVAWFDAFMEMQVYGKTRKEQTVRIGNKVINVDKKVDALLSFIAKTSLGGGNILKHIANGIQGQVQLAVEAYSQQFFSRKTLLSASTAYYAHAPELFTDLGEPYPKSFLGQLLIEFDAIQGQFMDELGNELGKSAVNKLFTGGYWMAGMGAGEHFNQTRLLIAMMKNTMVKQNGKEITLWEAYEKDENGKLRLKQGVEFTDQQRSAFVDKLHSINKGMFGVYNKFDTPVAKRTAQGRMLLLFRSFLYAYWKRRFSPNRVDVESGLEMEGYYSTFFQVMTRRFKDLAFLLGKDVDTLTDVQKANVRRALAEITIALTLAALAAVLRAADDDDEEKSWAYNALLYEIVRAKSEAMALIPVLGTRDMLRTLSTPSIATTTIQRFSDLVGQIIYDPTGVYERGYGFAEKGDNKAWIKFLRLIGLTRYNLNPDVATKFYLGRVF